MPLCQAPLGGRVASGAREWSQRGGIEANRANWKVGLEVGALFAMRALPASPVHIWRTYIEDSYTMLITDCIVA